MNLVSKSKAAKSQADVKDPSLSFPFTTMKPKKDNTLPNGLPMKKKRRLKKADSRNEPKSQELPENLPPETSPPTTEEKSPEKAVLKSKFRGKKLPTIDLIALHNGQNLDVVKEEMEEEV